MRYKDVPVMYEHVPIKTRTIGFRTVPMVDIPELFRHIPIALEKYQERIRGIEARLDKVLEKNS